jgi:predicted neutral ceramidase superfamily lipid hydrolase
MDEIVSHKKNKKLWNVDITKRHLYFSFFLKFRYLEMFNAYGKSVFAGLFVSAAYVRNIFQSLNVFDELRLTCTQKLIWMVLYIALYLSFLTRICVDIFIKILHCRIEWNPV